MTFYALAGCFFWPHKVGHVKKINSLFLHNHKKFIILLPREQRENTMARWHSEDGGGDQNERQERIFILFF
jgi:hypothetical protein